MDLELPSLPDDVLAGFLCRLAPRCLATSRCVCMAWRRVIDTHRLLRADLLPLSLGGIFLNEKDVNFSQFLSRPTTGAAVSGRLDYTVPGKPDDMPSIWVRDHCNGLLLLDHCMVNPATRQWALLPPLPWDISGFKDKYLVFDPTLSPDYELLIVPDAAFKPSESGESEWPLSTLILSVFSSKTDSWEQRTFSRDGLISWTLPGAVGSVRFKRHQCGYWRGALYIGCSYYFVVRISLSDNTYQVIRLPTEDGEPGNLYLGKSVKGIYCAAVFDSQLQVWFLNDQTEWVLKHDRDIASIAPQPILGEHDTQCGPWILHDLKHPDDDWLRIHNFPVDEDSPEEDNNEAIADGIFDWDSDNDNVLEHGGFWSYYMVILGFHPFKEVVFFDDGDIMLAYNWSTSKVQRLGKVFPKFYTDRRRTGFYHNEVIDESYPYTPCWMGELPEKLNSEAQLEY